MPYFGSMNKILFILFVLVFVGKISAQEVLFPLNRDLDTRIESFINADTSGFHTSVKPLLYPELRKAVPVDSVFSPIVKEGKFTKTWVGRKLFKEHLLFINEDDIVLSVDPVFNLQFGKESQSDPNYFVNTRGLLVQGNVKDKFYFYTGFHENQARYVSYIDSSVHATNVVPGQGIVKFNADQVFDFSQATGGIGYILNKHFDFLFASDKNFIGDGYRSLLLSDNSYSYPFLRINMTFWKFRYTVLYTVYRDLQTAPDPNVGYYKKYNTVHNLDLNIGRKNKVTVSIFETVMWAPSASRGYELAYLNPMLFIRPVENSLGSPDNVLLGSNLRWKVNPTNTVYGQVMLDEFLMDEVKAGNGWWGNKQGFQIGFKSSNLFKVKNLNFRSEYNWVRPYTYQHRTSSQSYNQYNQALGHPLGANFSESVSFINYRYKNLFAELKVQIATMGKDTADLNLGNDIFKSYETRNSDYGHYMFDGLKSDLNSVDLRVNYLINPKYNFVIEAGLNMRKFENDRQNDRSTFVYFGIRTSLENYYFDF